MVVCSCEFSAFRPILIRLAAGRKVDGNNMTHGDETVRVVGVVRAQIFECIKKSGAQKSRIRKNQEERGNQEDTNSSIDIDYFLSVRFSDLRQRNGLMTRPRKVLISLADTPYYHITLRCVRRAFLCGIDHYSGQNYEHRRQWVVDRIRLLS